MSPGAALPPAPRGARLLLIKPKMIGDTLLATPALQALRRVRPDLTLDLVVRTGSEPMLGAVPGLGRILLTVPPDNERRTGGLRETWRWIRRLREVAYDGACDLTGTERGHFILLGARARLKLAAPSAADLHARALWRRIVPIPAIPDWDRLHAVERDAAVLAAFTGVPLRDLSLSFPADRATPPVALPPGYAIVHPGSRQPAKLWAEDRWAGVIRHLAETCGHVVLSSGRDAAEVSLCQRLAAAVPGAATVTAGAWSWEQLAAAMRGARVFAGADTAAAHLAAATGLPAVVVWGPSVEQIWAPWSERAWLVLEDAIVPAAVARQGAPAPGALTRHTAANRVETVLAALRLALAAPRS